MRETIEFGSNKASEAEIAEHLSHFDADFLLPLSGRIEINNHARKIASKATRFAAWSGGKLTGLAAAHCNDQEALITHIASVSVLKASMGKGIAAKLMKPCIEHVRMSGMEQISLEVASAHVPAIRLYGKNGFVAA